MEITNQRTSGGIPIRVVPADRPGGGIPLLFIHENRGLTPYMLEVIDDLASEGFDVCAPDLLHRVGGSRPDLPDELTTRAVDVTTHEADLRAAFDEMTPTPAVLGFCFGAEMGWRLITHRTPTKAALLYGVGPEALDSIRCPVFAVYAEDDPRVNASVDDLCEGLAGTALDYTLESYPGTRHAFHDHSRPDRHHPEAAAAVWRRTIDFLENPPADAPQTIAE